jgi:hypothetical protein
MKWLVNLFKKEEKLKLGDVVMSDDNVYGREANCTITRIYWRKSYSEKVRFCRLEFDYYGFNRVINVMYKSCKKVEQ